MDDTAPDENNNGIFLGDVTFYEEQPTTTAIAGAFRELFTHLTEYRFSDSGALVETLKFRDLRS